MKDMIKQLYQRFISLKSMWWTHVLSILTNIFFIPYFILIIINIIINIIICFTNGSGIKEYSILNGIISIIFIIISYGIIMPITIVVFITEMFTSFKLVVKNKILIKNPVYHTFWLTGFIIFIINMLIIFILRLKYCLGF